MRSTKGFTLLEAVMITALVGVLGLMAFPRLERAVVARDMRGARASLTSLWLRARSVAALQRRPATLRIGSGAATVEIRRHDGTTDRIAAVGIEQTFGVQIAASGPSLIVQPTGAVSRGTPFTIWLRKAGRVDSLTVTGYGRIR